MAYESRYRILVLTSLASAFVSAFSSALDRASDIWTDLQSAFSSIDWPSFIPDARTSLALDGMNREFNADREPSGSRFKAFVTRALTHDRFGAGHFDVGRMPA